MISIDKKIEREATEFAMCLLMPEELLREEIKKLNNGQGLQDFSDIETLADICKVSAPVMTLRLQKLKLINY